MKIFTIKLDESGAMLLFAEGHYVAAPRDGAGLVAAMTQYNAAHDRRAVREARAVEILPRAEQERLIAAWLARNGGRGRGAQQALTLEEL